MLRNSRSFAAGRVLPCVLGALALAACEDFEPPAGAAAPRNTSDASVPTGQAPSDGDTSTPVAPAIDASITQPELPIARAQASRSHVLVPNPREHSIAVIAPGTLESLQLPCARTPSLLAASERSELALAVDVDERTGCVLDLAGEPVRTAELPTVAHVNALALSPDGRYALAYHDRSAAEHADEPAFDTVEVSVVRLGAPASAADVLVGLHPREVSFSSDGETAFVASDAGISVIALAAAARGELGQAPPRGLTDGPFLHEATLRVAPDGARALAFETDGAQLFVLELLSGLSRSIDLAQWAQAAALDADAGVELSEPRIADAVIDRAGTRAYVALRGEQSVLEIPLPRALSDVLAVELHALPGQPSDRLELARGDENRLLVLAGTAGDGRASVLRVTDESGSLRVPLVAAPGSVLADDQGQAFVLLHGQDASAPSGYSVVRASDGLSRFTQTQAPPLALALSNEALALAAVAQPSGEQHAALDVVDLRTLARVSQPLTGTALATGFAAQGRYLFVQLAHPDGRLVLFDMERGEPRTTTGFLIAPRVGQ